MTADARPPRVAETILRLLLQPGARDSVSGDLLEEYRECVCPARGRWRADLWYLRQVAGFVWRTAWVWGVLLAAAVIARDALDWWLAPTQEFYARSIASTAIAVSLFTWSGFVTAWRSRSVPAGALAGVATGAISAAIVNLTSLVLLAVRHDPHTMTMIRASGGLDEVFVLPLIVIVPGTLCAAAGAAVGRMLAWSLDVVRT
jgi:hypothetical protein